MKNINSTKRLHKIHWKSYRLLNGRRKSLVERIGDGSIIRRFDKSAYPRNPSDIVCPHFLELKWAYGCPFDCSWCYLKGTFRFRPEGIKPVIKDINKTKLHTMTFLRAVETPEILNTGEIADSLMAEKRKFSFAKEIIPLFETQTKHKVLFLTKSINISNLLSISKHNQVIISYSLNAETVARKWEKRSPTVKRRIQAAKRLVDAGYKIRIRIDPLVPIEHWQKHYRSLIDLLFGNLLPERITFGSLRGLQSTLNATKDNSWKSYLTENSNWGKKVEFSQRFDIYAEMVDYLKREYKFSKVAFCKETLALWKKIKMDYREIHCNCVW